MINQRGVVVMSSIVDCPNWVSHFHDEFDEELRHFYLGKHYTNPQKRLCEFYGS